MNKAFSVQVHFFSGEFFPNIRQSIEVTVLHNQTVEDLLLKCADRINVSCYAFPYYGLCSNTSTGIRFWLNPCQKMVEIIDDTEVDKTGVFFRFRFKPPRNLPKMNLKRKTRSSKNYGFRALLQQSLILQDELWSLLLGQCEHDLEIDTLFRMDTKKNFRADLWALLLLGRNEKNFKKEKWKKDAEISQAIPVSINKHKYKKDFIRNVAHKLPIAIANFRGFTIRDIQLTFLQEFIYENNTRIIDHYEVLFEATYDQGHVFFDTQDCECYPIIKFRSRENAHCLDVCSLKDISSYYVDSKLSRITLHLCREGQTASFKFENQKLLCSFASEIDAQYRTTVDWYANLNSNVPKICFSPRIETLRFNFVMPPTGFSNSVPGIRITDNVPANMLSVRPFLLQQSSQKIGCLKVEFSQHIVEEGNLEFWQLRLQWNDDWTIQDFGGAFDLPEILQGSFPTLEDICQALLDALPCRGMTLNHNWIGSLSDEDRQTMQVRMAEIGRSPKIHYIDPELVEDFRYDNKFQGLPVLCSNVLVLSHLVDGNYTRLHFGSWNGTPYLVREYSGARNHLSAFWKVAETSSKWSHHGLASVVAFSPSSDFYLLDFASGGPLDFYLSHDCNSAVYLTHLLIAIKTLMEAVLYLFEQNFNHGDIRLANVLLFSHTVDPRTFEIKLVPPELINSKSELSCATQREPNIAIFHPRNRKSNDLYSLGITCIQILCFGAIPTEADINNIRSDVPTLPIFEDHFKKKEQQKEYLKIIKELFLIVRDCINQSLELEDKSERCQFLLSAIKKIIDLMELAKGKPQIALNDVFAPAFEKELSTFKYNVIPLNELFEPLSMEILPKKRNGCFGEVIFQEWRKGENVQLVALKRLIHGLDDQLSLTRLTHEFIIWANLKHDNIVKIYGLTWFDARPSIVMECVGHGSTLKDLSKEYNRENAEFFPVMVSLLIQVTNGMKFLSERNKPIVHCDLAARNVLVQKETGNASRKYTAKIADFGLACVVDPSLAFCRLPVSLKMPYDSTAPEIFQTRQATPKADVWSFGVLSWEVLCQKTPVRRYFKAPNRTLFDKDIPVQLVDCLENCWEKNPDRRPTFQRLEILLSEILRNNF